MPNTRSAALRAVPFAAALAVVILDRFSKLQIQHSIAAFESIPVIPGWLRIVHTENPGAAFGMLADGNPLVRSAVLVGVSAVVLIFVAAALLSRSASFTSGLTRSGLGLILGGAIGNLYDRVVHGAVTDFIEVYHGSWAFPAFNVADSAITIGACLLLIDLLRPHRKHVQQAVEAASK